jgi:hypothetical protein
VGAQLVCRLLMVIVCVGCDTRAHANDAPMKAEIDITQRGLTFLRGLPREWSGTSDRDCKTYEAKNVDRLGSSFASSAAAFLNAFRVVHGSVTITSAHRTREEQTCVCLGEKGPCAGRPRVVKKEKGRRMVVRSTSRHQLGIALDVRPGTGSGDEFICLHEFAEFNPQFGVAFPLGKRDRPHMEPRRALVTPVKVATLGAAPTTVAPCTRMKIMLTHDHVD